MVESDKKKKTRATIQIDELGELDDNDADILISNEPDNSNIDSLILNAADISTENNDEIEELLKKQRQCEIEEHEKYMIAKILYKTKNWVRYSYP